MGEEHTRRAKTLRASQISTTHVIQHKGRWWNVTGTFNTTTHTRALSLQRHDGDTTHEDFLVLDNDATVRIQEAHDD